MSKFQKVRDDFDEMDTDMKIFAVIMILVALLIGLAIAAILVALIKEIFIPALVILAIYGWGAHKRGWPVPKFLKKFM